MGNYQRLGIFPTTMDKKEEYMKCCDLCKDFFMTKYTADVSRRRPEHFLNHKGQPEKLCLLYQLTNRTINSGSSIGASGHTAFGVSASVNASYG